MDRDDLVAGWHQAALSMRFNTWKRALEHHEDRACLDAALARYRAAVAAWDALVEEAGSPFHDFGEVGKAVSRKRAWTRKAAFDALHAFYWARGLDKDMEVRAGTIYLPERPPPKRQRPGTRIGPYMPLEVLRRATYNDLKRWYDYPPELHEAMMAHAADIQLAHEARTELG